MKKYKPSKEVLSSLPARVIQYNNDIVTGYHLPRSTPSNKFLCGLLVHKDSKYVNLDGDAAGVCLNCVRSWSKQHARKKKKNDDI